MKRNLAGRSLPVTTLCWGLLALVLRWQLYRSAVDEKGLLAQSHPLSIALVILTAGVLIRSLLSVRKLELPQGHPEQLSPSAIGAFGHAAAAAGILIAVLTGAPLAGNSFLSGAWKILGLAAPVCLMLAALSRMRGRMPCFLLYVTVCLFFLVHIVSRYQLWSGNPQMQDYVFSLLGAMALMFFGYYSAAWSAGVGSIRMLHGFGLAAVYLCAAELARSACPELYLGGICWVLADLFDGYRVCTDGCK